MFYTDLDYHHPHLCSRNKQSHDFSLLSKTCLLGEECQICKLHLLIGKFEGKRMSKYVNYICLLEALTR